MPSTTSLSKDETPDDTVSNSLPATDNVPGVKPVQSHEASTQTLLSLPPWLSVHAISSQQPASNPGNATILNVFQLPPSHETMEQLYHVNFTSITQPDGGMSPGLPHLIDLQALSSITNHELNNNGPPNSFIAALGAAVEPPGNWWWSSSNGPVPEGTWNHDYSQSPLDAVSLINAFEIVEIFTIPAADMKCSYCWLPFGTTDEDDPCYVYSPDLEADSEASEYVSTFKELPFHERSSNDPVRTPCGHLFGKTCLIEVLEKMDPICPLCRQDLRKKT